MDTLSAWLQTLGLERYASVFSENEVDLETLRVLTEADLEQLGLPFGPRKKLLKALAGFAPQRIDPVATASEPKQQVEAVPSSSDGERRQLTVMFCDLVGSTALSRQLDPEQLRELMRAYQRVCGKVIEKYEGHVAQYLGDGLMVYFGWPQAHEDDAERAALAALEIVDAVKAVPAAPPLQVRIGIATGRVVVGETGAGDASVPKIAVGETPNLAARLQGLAGPDEIVVGPYTRPLLGSSFECFDLGQHVLKGIVEPVQAWRVVGAASVEGRFEAKRETGALTPLVGREEEIQLLLRRWDQAKAGEGQAVLLCGEPGVGKSRLVQVLRERLVREPHTRLRYQCSPFHANSAFYPVTEQFERAAGFSRDDSLERKLDKMEAILGAAVDNVQTVAALFAEMLSLPAERYPAARLSPQQRKEATIEALVDQVLGLARAQPVLFMFEDAHWADPSTLETLDRLVDQTESGRVLIVLTYRPGFQPAWVGQPRVTTLTLARLSRREAAALAEKVSRGKLLPPEVLDQIVVKTDGVPLFVEELTKAVIESGLLHDAGDRHDLVGPLPPLAIPSTLQDSLMARLDRLAPIKEVVQIAAAIGREFSHELLAALWTLSTQQLQDALRQLVASELVFQHGEPPVATYTFKHALVQDAAYQSILHSRRQQLHARIARTLDERFPELTEGAPELLAAHYEKAGASDEAIGWYLRAGYRAKVRSANKEAVSHLERALSLLDQISDAQQRLSLEIDIRANLGTLHMTLEGWTSAKSKAQFERVHELRDIPGHEQQRFKARAGLVMAFSWTGRASEARLLGEELVHAANASKQRIHKLIAHERYGNSLMYLGRYQDALDQWERVLELYDRETDVGLSFEYGHDPAVCALAFSAYMHWQLGYPEKARHCADASVALARSVGHAFTLAFALTYGGADVSYFMGDPVRALAFAREGEEVTKKGGFVHQLAICSFHRAWSLSRLDSSSEALDGMRHALDDLQQLGMVTIIAPRMNAQLAEAYGRAGKPEEGLEVLASSPDRAPGRTRVRFSATYWIEGDLHLAKSRPDPALAESCYLEAVAIAIEDNAKMPRLRASLRLAQLWLDQGKTGQACNLLQPVYDSFTEGFETADLVTAKQVLERARTETSTESRPAA